MKKICVALALVLLLAAGNAVFSPDHPKAEAVSYATMEHGWELILVNQDHYIPEDYTVELLTLSNGQEVDLRIYPALQRMFDDARAEGIYPFVVAGYRTQEKQKSILEERMWEYMFDGLSRKEAEAEARKWVAAPGTSEHQLGMAVDINPDTSRSTADQVYGWLAENAHRYGFIQRYPANKAQLTGISHEPWHYRYVGVQAATEIYAQGLCLEEYVQQLEQGDS